MRRPAVFVLTLVVALAGTAGLLVFFQSRDDANLATTAEGPGVADPEATTDRLRLGNVVLTYKAERDGAALRALAEDVGGPEDPALADAGQAVFVERRPDQRDAVVARAFERRLGAGSAQDPQVRRFVEFWLGRAATE